MKPMQCFSYRNLALFTKKIKSLFSTVLGQYGLIFDDIGWWSGISKGGDSTYDIDTGLNDIA